MRWAWTMGALLAITAGGPAGGCLPHSDTDQTLFQIGGGPLPAEGWDLEGSIATGSTFTVTGTAVDDEGEPIQTSLVSGDEDVLIPLGSEGAGGAWATFEAGDSGRGTVDLVDREEDVLLGILDLHVREPVGLDLRLTGGRTPPSVFAIPLGSVMASHVELSDENGRPLQHYDVVTARVEGTSVTANTGGDVVKLTPGEPGTSAVTLTAGKEAAAATYQVRAIYASSITRIDLAVHQQCGVDEATVIAEMETSDGYVVLGQPVAWNAPDGTLASMEADTVQVLLGDGKQVAVSASTAGLSATVDVVPVDCEPTACALASVGGEASAMALLLPGLAIAWRLRRRTPIL